MSSVTLIDCYNNFINTMSTPDDNFLHFDGFMCDEFYKKNANSLDRKLIFEHGKKTLFNTDIADSEINVIYEKHFKPLFSMFLSDKKYKYDTLFKTTMLDYNPIENYNREESVTTEYTGTETNNLEFNGSEKNVIGYNGSEKETVTKSGTENTERIESGTETNSNTNTGTETDTSVVGNTLTTTTNSVSADDYSEFSNDTKSVVEDNERTNTVTKQFNDRVNESTLSFDNRKTKDTTSFENREDVSEKTFTNRNDENVKTFENRKNTETKSFDSRKDIITSTVKGNIGVTTSQQMLESERNVALFEFFSILFNDFANECLLYVNDWGCDAWLINSSLL